MPGFAAISNALFIRRVFAVQIRHWRRYGRFLGILGVLSYHHISAAEPLDLAQCQRIYHQHQATLQQLRQGYSIAQGRQLKQVQQMQVELLTHQCPFNLSQLSQASMAALQAVQQRGIQRRGSQRHTASRPPATLRSQIPQHTAKNTKASKAQRQSATTAPVQTPSTVSPSLRKPRDAFRKTKPNTVTTQDTLHDTAPQLFASHIGSQGRYQGIKWRYWQKFYQEPKRCFRQRDSHWMVYCSERRLLAQQMFDLLWPELAQALQQNGDMMPTVHQ